MNDFQKKKKKTPLEGLTVDSLLISLIRSHNIVGNSAEDNGVVSGGTALGCYAQRHLLTAAAVDPFGFFEHVSILQSEKALSACRTLSHSQQVHEAAGEHGSSRKKVGSRKIEKASKPKANEANPLVGIIQETGEPTQI